MVLNVHINHKAYQGRGEGGGRWCGGGGGGGRWGRGEGDSGGDNVAIGM